MQMAQSNVAQPIQRKKSPFMGILENISGALTPFFPEAGMANTGLHILDGSGSGGGSPFQAQNAQSAKPNSQPPASSLTSPSKLTPTPPVEENTTNTSISNPDNIGPSQSQAGSAPNSPQTTPAMQQQVHQWYNQYPEEMGAIMKNPQILQGGQNLIATMQQYAQMLGQQQNQGGM